MLGHADRDRGQLRDLVPPRLRRVDPLRLAEHVRARPAPLGPVLDDLVDLLGRKQPSVATLMPGLTTARPTRPLPARTRRCRRRILRGWQRGVARRAAQPSLELTDPSLEPLVRLDQLAHPHQQCERRLPVTIENPLCLNPLHTLEFATPKRVPPGEGERLLFSSYERAGLEPAASGLLKPTSAFRRWPAIVRDFSQEQGFSLIALRGLAVCFGDFRRPRAGCTRDGSVGYQEDTWLTNHGLWRHAPEVTTPARGHAMSVLRAASSPDPPARRPPASAR